METTWDLCWGFQIAVPLLTSLTTQYLHQGLAVPGVCGRAGAGSGYTKELFGTIPFRARLRKFSFFPLLILGALFSLKQHNFVTSEIAGNFQKQKFVDFFFPEVRESLIFRTKGPDYSFGRGVCGGRYDWFIFSQRTEMADATEKKIVNSPAG